MTGNILTAFPARPPHSVQLAWLVTLVVIASVLVLSRWVIVIGRWFLHERPMWRGSWVRLGPDAVGVVDAVGIRNIRLRTGDRRQLVVRSSRLVTLQADVLALRETCRLHASLGVVNTRKPDQLATIRAEIEGILYRHADHTPGEMVVRFVSSSETELSLDITAQFATAQYREFRRWRRETLADITRLLDRQSASFYLR